MATPWPHLILILIWSSPGTSLQVYSCDAPSTQFEAIDLTSPGQCPDPITDFDEPKTIDLQVLATEEEFPVIAHTCTVIMSKKVTACSWIDSTTFASTWTLWEHSYLVSSTECQQAVETGRISVEGKEYTVEPGSVLNTRFVSQGRIANDGRCWGLDIISAGQVYPESYEETILRIKLEKIHGAAKLESGQVHFQNGVIGVTRERFARDPSSFGIMVWDTDPPECQETVMTVYRGEADFHNRKDAKDKTGSVIMVANDKEDQYAAIVLKDRVVICDNVCYTTAIPGLIACIRTPGQPDVPSRTVTRTDPAVRDFYSAMQNLHVRKSLSDNNRFAQVQRDLCATERKTIATKLHNLAGTSNPYSLLDVDNFDGRGYSVFVAGSVAYLTKCAPAEAVLASYPECKMKFQSG